MNKFIIAGPVEWNKLFVLFYSTAGPAVLRYNIIKVINIFITKI